MINARVLTPRVKELGGAGVREPGESRGNTVRIYVLSPCGGLCAVFPATSVSLSTPNNKTKRGNINRHVPCPQRMLQTKHSEIRVCDSIRRWKSRRVRPGCTFCFPTERKTRLRKPAASGYSTKTGTSKPVEAQSARVRVITGTTHGSIDPS